MRGKDTLRVAHVITTISAGGATENTLLSAAGLKAMGTYDAEILAGPPISSEGDLSDQSAQLGVKVEIIPTLRREIGVRADVRAFLDLVRTLRAGDYDIVHTHASKGGVLGRLAARAVGVPVVTHTFHAFPFTDESPYLKRLFYIETERLAARWSDGLLSVSRDMVRRGERYGMFRPGECSVARSGMDLARFLRPQPRRDEIRGKWGLNVHNVALGIIGRVYANYKGQDLLVELAPRLCSAVPSLRIVVIGGGPLVGLLEARAAEMGLSDHVLFVGSYPPEEMPEVISALDVLVLASTHEGLARVIVQALACRKPVISYDLDGSPEVVADRVNGRLVEPGNKDALVAAIAEIAARGELRRAWGERGPAAVDPEFRAETMVRQIDAAYRKFARRVGLPLPPVRDVPSFETWGRLPRSLGRWVTNAPVARNPAPHRH